MGRYEEAHQYYADTVKIYLDQRGMRPFRKLIDSFRNLGNQFVHPRNSLESIRSDMEEQQMNGPYVCSYPVFRGIYRALKRMSMSSGHTVYLMLCTIVDSKGNPMQEGKKLDELDERLTESIRKAVCGSDVVSRYGKGQYLILLANIELEECCATEKKISGYFRIGRQRTGVKYQIINITQNNENQSL